MYYNTLILVKLLRLLVMHMALVLEVLAFFSKKLNEATQKYSINEKELFVVVQSLRY